MSRVIIFFSLLLLILPAFCYSATLVNINAADASLLDTLPGIGPSKATAIVDYRTQNGPFARIEDIQNVSGIGPSTYAGLAPFITVGDTTVTNTTTATSSVPDTTSSGGATTYVPPPSELAVTLMASTQATLNVPLHLSAKVISKGSTIDGNARVVWSFGDGSSAEGTIADKTYRYAGAYVISVDATDGSATGHDEVVVVAEASHVHIASISGDGITISNDSSVRLDLSDWRLSADTSTFRIPHGTVLLPKSNVLFPSTITNLPTTFDTTLSYPDGMTAVRYSAPDISVATDVQPSVVSVRSNAVQTVDAPSVPPTSVSTPAHENTSGLAPTATVETAAVGATLLPDASATPAVHKSVFSSWTLGLVGVIVAAGGAFILL